MYSASPRELVTEAVTRRATHIELDHVTDTLVCVERPSGLPPLQYHGRFLMEFLQNVRDAYAVMTPTEAGGRDQAG